LKKASIRSPARSPTIPARRIPAGESWGGDKMGNFDWYVEGVIGKAK
jgi:hypothetical protein